MLAMEGVENRTTRARSRRTNGFVERLNRTLLDVEADPYNTIIYECSRDRLEPETRKAKRNLNLVSGTILFAMIAYGLEWPEEVKVLGLAFEPGAGLSWALAGLLLYHLLHFWSYVWADGKQYLVSRNDTPCILERDEALLSRAVVRGRAHS